MASADDLASGIGVAVGGMLTMWILFLYSKKNATGRFKDASNPKRTLVVHSAYDIPQSKNLIRNLVQNSPDYVFVSESEDTMFVDKALKMTEGACAFRLVMTATGDGSTIKIDSVPKFGMDPMNVLKKPTAKFAEAVQGVLSAGS